jgi:anaerobic selenocysteine-containing dehydrogenase
LPEPARLALLEGGPTPIPGGGRPVQFVDVWPNTPDRKVRLWPADLIPDGRAYAYAGDPATADYPLALISPSSEHTVSSTLGEFRPGIAAAKIHPDDAAARTISDDDEIRIFNALGDVHCRATVTPEVRPGVVSLPKGLWTKSTLNGQTANALAPDSLADLGGGACFNDARVQVELLARA